jgi:hypothetical protein
MVSINIEQERRRRAPQHSRRVLIDLQPLEINHRTNN